jgi:hypothetical protein
MDAALDGRTQPCLRRIGGAVDQEIQWFNARTKRPAPRVSLAGGFGFGFDFVG